MDLRQGVVISKTNLVDSKREVSFPWKGFLTVLFLTFLIWAGAFSFNSFQKSKVKDLQNSVNSVKGDRDYKKIAYVADTESRLASSRAILEKRVNWDSFFQKLEQNTLPEVVFENMETDSEDKSNQISVTAPASPVGNKYILSLKGRTVGVDVLAKQIAAFKDGGEKAFASEVQLENVSLKATEEDPTVEGATAGGSGAIEFSIRLTLNSDILKIDLGSDSPSVESVN